MHHIFPSVLSPKSSFYTLRIRWILHFLTSNIKTLRLIKILPHGSGRARSILNWKKIGWPTHHLSFDNESWVEGRWKHMEVVGPEAQTTLKRNWQFALFLRSNTIFLSVSELLPCVIHEEVSSGTCWLPVRPNVMVM